MSLISFCGPAYAPVRSEQERLTDGKGIALFYNSLVSEQQTQRAAALVLASVLCAALEGSHWNVVEVGKIPSLRS